jgi:hypothetical protein
MIALMGASFQALAKKEKISASDFRAENRKLWSEHAIWTRNVIFNIIDDLPGTTEAVNRLLRNQDDIGNAFKPFYGNAAGDSLSGLLRRHITTAAEVLIALNADDAAGLTTASTKWYANADSIAMFLSSLNPFWELTEMRDMMNQHLALTTSEAVARHTANYPADVTAFDSVYMDILMMADMLSIGIEKQFPSAFSTGPKARAAQGATIDEHYAPITLAQNAPNPFAEKTIISYYLPQNIGKAHIEIMDVNGKLVKTIAITEKGSGNVTVYAPSLGNGMYIYNIIADGKMIDSKKMLRQE